MNYRYCSPTWVNEGALPNLDLSRNIHNISDFQVASEETLVYSTVPCGSWLGENQGDDGDGNEKKTGLNSKGQLVALTASHARNMAKVRANIGRFGTMSYPRECHFAAGHKTRNLRKSQRVEPLTIKMSPVPDNSIIDKYSF